MNVLEKHEAELKTQVAITKENLETYIEQNNIPDFFPPNIDEKFDELLGKYEAAKFKLMLWKES